MSVITDGKQAEILRTQIGLLEAQRDDAVLRADKFALSVSELKSENQKLCQEVTNLRKSVSEQKRIDDQAAAILKHLFEYDADFTVDSIAHTFGLKTSIVKFHFEELARLGLITQGDSEPQPYMIGYEQPWAKPTVRISTDGRRQVVKGTT